MRNELPQPVSDCKRKQQQTAKQKDSTSAITHKSKFANGNLVSRRPKIGAMTNYNKLMQ